MRTAYFDCINGAAGDMLVAALLDAGADFDQLRGDLAKLQITGYELRAFRTTAMGIGCSRFEVVVTQTQPERHLRDVLAILVQSELPKSVVERATRVFARLAVAEGKVHGMPPDRVHFHEVGAVDALVDIVSVILCLDQLGIEEVVSSPLPLGSGLVHCEHGTIPVPVPAVVELLRNVPVYDNGESGELVTPTGAAILTSCAREFGRLPRMRLSSSGFGAGAREGKEVPNVVRALIGEVAALAGVVSEEAASEVVGILETNIDDQNPQLFECVMDRLYEAGALDVFLTPVVMKRGRPGIKLTIILPLSRQADCQRIVFSETTAIGLRFYTVRRKTLDREVVAVQTDFGPIRVKVARELGAIANLSPEFKDCVAAAQAKGVSVKHVWQVTLARALSTPGLRA